MEAAAVRLPNQQMANVIMLVPTNDDDGLANQGVERISHNSIRCRAPGIMTLLLTAALNIGP